MSLNSTTNNVDSRLLHAYRITMLLLVYEAMVYGLACLVYSFCSGQLVWTFLAIKGMLAISLPAILIMFHYMWVKRRLNRPA